MSGYTELETKVNYNKKEGCFTPLTEYDIGNRNTVNVLVVNYWNNPNGTIKQRATNNYKASLAIR